MRRYLMSNENGITFKRSLPGQVEKTIGKLEELFQEIFKQISYFQEHLATQEGKAASSLKSNLNKHIEMMAKSSPVLLNFADVMKNFMNIIQATDDDKIVSGALVGRAEYQYSLSTERIDEDITLDADSLKDATTKFKSNLTNVAELFSSFSKLLAEAIEGVYLPWDDLAGTWDEAKKKVKSVTEKTEEHIDKLIKEANAFVTEISRVDHLVANQMMA